jgi:hypothetical protein
MLRSIWSSKKSRKTRTHSSLTAGKESGGDPFAPPMTARKDGQELAACVIPGGSSARWHTGRSQYAAFLKRSLERFTKARTVRIRSFDCSVFQLADIPGAHSMPTSNERLQERSFEAVLMRRVWVLGWSFFRIFMPEAKQSFLHDSDAHADERIMELRASHGWAGYGIYWALIEIMRANNELQINIERIRALAYGLNAEEALLRGVIEVGVQVGLFEQVDGFISSPALRRRIAAFEAQKQVRAERARTASARRWQSRTSSTTSTDAYARDVDAQALLEHCTSNADGMHKQCSVNTNTNPNLNINQNQNTNPIRATEHCASQAELVTVERNRKAVAPRVTMTDAEHASLVEEFGRESVAYHVKVCSDYLLSSGKTKKNSAAFVRNWIRREIAECKGFYHQQGRKNFTNSRERNEQREALAMDRLRQVEESGAKSLFHMNLPEQKKIGGAQ